VDFDFVGDLTWLMLDGVMPLMAWAPDSLDAFVDDQRSMVRIEEAKEARIRKLTSIGSGEVFPAGFVIMQAPGGRHRIRYDVIVAVTEHDFVVLNADVQHDPDGEIGRIRRADVTGVRMLDEAGNPISMTQARDVLELDEPEHSYVVALDGRVEEAEANAFVFRSLSVADEARRDFERNLAKTA
jgi:hypothetical protein